MRVAVRAEAPRQSSYLSGSVKLCQTALPVPQTSSSETLPSTHPCKAARQRTRHALELVLSVHPHHAHAAANADQQVGVVL